MANTYVLWVWTAVSDQMPIQLPVADSVAGCIQNMVEKVCLNESNLNISINKVCEHGIEV